MSGLYSATITFRFKADSQLDLDSRRAQLAVLLEVVSHDFDDGSLTITEGGSLSYADTRSYTKVRATPVDQRGRR